MGPMAILYGLGTLLGIFQMGDAVSGGGLSDWLGETFGRGKAGKTKEAQQTAYQEQLALAGDQTKYQEEATRFTFNWMDEFVKRGEQESQFQFREKSRLAEQSSKLEAGAKQFGSIMEAMPQLTSRDPQFAVPFNPNYPNITSLMTPGQM